MSEMSLMSGVIEFIGEVEKRPCIYNTTLPSYSNRHETKRAWDEIGKIFGMKENECREKWRKIRLAFTRSMKQLKSSPMSTRKYYLYDQMAFLLPFMRLGDEFTSPGSPVTSEEEQSERYDTEVPILKAEICSDSDDSFRNVPENTHEYLKERVFLRPEKILEERETQVKKRKVEESIENNPRKMFLLSLLPEIERFSDDEMRQFRRGVISCIDNIMDKSKPQDSCST